MELSSGWSRLLGGKGFVPRPNMQLLLTHRNQDGGMALLESLERCQEPAPEVAPMCEATRTQEGCWIWFSPHLWMLEPGPPGLALPSSP